MKSFNRAEMRELDRRTIEDVGIPGVILMENAGRGASAYFAQLLADVPGNSIHFTDLTQCHNAMIGKKILIVNGQGNNGGDGFVIARHLHNWGADVKIIFLTKNKIDKWAENPGDAEINHKIAVAMNIEINNIVSSDELEKFEFSGFDAIVDGIFGTGLEREITGLQKLAIEKMNQVSGLKFAIDVPSGLNVDTGEIFGTCFHADATATFGGMKTGMMMNEAEKLTGKVKIIDISVPRKFYTEDK